MTHFTSQFFARIRREFTSDTGSRVEKGEIVHVSSIEQSNNFKCVRLNGSILEVPSDLVESVNIPPVGNFLVSIASYTGLSSKELSFDKYALIRLDEKVDENFYQGAILLDSGKAVGNGLFPANYTVPLPEVSNYGTTNGFAELIADLKAQLPGETNLVKGEKVKILEIKEDWCMVEKHDGSKGTCPIKFLKKIDSIPSATNAPRLYDQPSYDKPPVYDQPVDEKTPPRPIYEQPAQSYEPPEKPDDDQPYCRAVYDFKGEYEGELSFTTGDLIYLKRRVNDDWLEGACQKNSLMGIFPVSFVEIMVDLPTTTTTNATVNQQTLGVASVLFDFEGRFPDELSVSAGDSVNVIDFSGTDWARCWNPITEKTGIVPISFLQIFFDEDEPDYGSQNFEGIGFSSNRNSSEIPWEPGFSAFNLEASETKPATPTPFDLSFFEDSKTMSMASTTPAKPPSRPPPPKVAEKTSKTPPARPTNGPTNKQVEIKEKLAATNVKVCTDSDWASQKAKVVEEMLASETTYLMDLTCWENCIMSSISLDESQKSILTKGYAMLKSLSQNLIENITLHQELPHDQQCYGAMFMQMKEQFFKTFAVHFRCVEPMTQMIEQSRNTKLQNALKECLQEMRALGSNVFDVPTAIARPTQRCLKYPLYIGELINNTPLTHRDHPKLMESLKQMTQLASKMNEFKRKKELTRKYQENRPQSLINKLSKLNMHTFVKKSNRLKYRITSTMGFVTVKDDEFDYLIARLDDAERRVCRFLYATQIYKKKLQLAIKKYLDTYSIDPKKMSANVIADETTIWEFNNFLKKINHFAKDYVEELDKRVINVGKSLLRCEYTKLIHKRCDKLADYETAKQANKNVEEIQMRRCEYEALNSQVKNILPKVTETLGTKINELINLIHVLDAECFQRFDRWYHNERPQKLRIFPLIDFRQFADPRSQRFYAIDKTLFADTCMSMKPSSDLKRASTIIQDRQSPKTVQHLRPQSAKERDALVKIMKAQRRSGDLRRVKSDYESKDGAFMVRAGDIVAINRQEGMFCLCENGVTSGIVPFELLGPFEESHFSTPVSSPTKERTAPIYSQLRTVQSASSVQASPAKQETFTHQKSVDLIDLQDDLLDLFTPSLPSQTPLQPTTLQPQVISHLSPLPLIDYVIEPSPARDASQYRPLSVPTANAPSPMVFSPSNPFVATQPSQTMPTTTSQLMPTSTSTDPFEDLFRSAINMPLTRITPSPSHGSSPTPEIPDRPANSAASLPKPQGSSPMLWIPPPPKGPPPSLPAIPKQEPPPNKPQLSYDLPPPIPTNIEIASLSKANGENGQINKSKIEERRCYEEPPVELNKPSLYEEPPVEEVTQRRSLYEEPPSESPYARLPIRTAPLRPSTHASPMTYDFPPSKPADQSHEIYIADFDYSPDADDPNQIVVKEGDQVKVVKKQDDSGNFEWWLVEDSSGHSGYVPAAFLRSQFE